MTTALSPRRSNLHVVPSPSAPSPLIERAVELDVLRSSVARLESGASGVVVLEAPAGLGKTALLEYGASVAARSGFLVRRAAPGPLERHFAFGVVRALLEGPVREASPGEREHLLDGAAAAAGELLLDGTAPAGDSAMLIAHSVLWLCSAIAERRPLALVIDDAQWADRASLEVLSYLARRVDDLPLLLLIGARADDPDAASDLLTLLGSVRSATVLHPQPLTARGATQLIRRLAPETPAAVCRDCHRAVGGNPWLLGELGRQIAAHGPEALEDSEQDAPHVTAIARTVVRRRLAELCPRDRGVVAALAVIGDGAPPHVLAAVAGVPVGELGPARDALLAAGLLDSGFEAPKTLPCSAAPSAGMRFAHGLIAVAIAEELPRTERERLHREAARALMDCGADPGVVASHLLECGPQADPGVTELLLRAAAAAARGGVPRAAAAYLERALQERAPGDDRGKMLARLGTVAFDAGLPDSRRRLREALREVDDRECRIDVLTRLAALNLVDAGDEGLAQVFEQELAGEDDPDVRLAVEAASLDALLIFPERHAERARRVAAIDLSESADPLLERVVLAHRAWVGTELGAPSASVWAAMARSALDGGLLREEAHWRSAYSLSARVLVATDDPQAGEAIAGMRDVALERGSLRLRVAAEWYAADHALRTGRVGEAENHARLALDLVDDDTNVFSGGAAEVLVCALAERGAFGEARELLRERRLDGALGFAVWEIGLRHARARLWLGEGDFERAYAEAMEAGTLRAEQGRPNPSLEAWRSTAARALAHLGRREEAMALADAELALAERFGAPVPIATALHARAVAEPDHETRIALCRRGLAVAAGSSGLEAVRLRLELGSALASLGRRVEARDALRPALADADAAGAVALAQRARRELVATGLRPRHAAIEGAAALTPRQRQICELAAAGKGNRAIAQQLFLSIKTVETHLAAGYRKLGVNTRSELAAELAA
ncbi:AAA family ATPase [Solirubrobacter ginsenosidimutans]|uniref:AAA family ATPase n=1 Tax=Solirubrobacter ginsenosidimutans TaxID=490573 RepID=A0A9X3S809_9ACTN|nr:LuxR family transcriptional regulator [Solirubrobacter ginsenosidimutans]MDA0166546.1 AAA family ATPase [Solirubrobacter ginsenosidimutans]